MSHKPVLFLSHGSPMTAVEGGELSIVWTALAKRLTRPSAIVMISAHWTTDQPLIGGSERPETIHDFGGFPDELYRLRYPAPGAPALAHRIKQTLDQHGYEAEIDSAQGLDHGAWVPLRTLFPAADIPVLPLSVQPHRDATHHVGVGKALASLPADNILIIASGHMTHNLSEFMSNDTASPSLAARAFRDWAHARLVSSDTAALEAWQNAAPNPRTAHPTPEHFLPLFVALGAVGSAYQTESLGGGWIGNSLAADNYAFTSH